MHCVQPEVGIQHTMLLSWDIGEEAMLNRSMAVYIVNSEHCMVYSVATQAFSVIYNERTNCFLF